MRTVVPPPVVLLVLIVACVGATPSLAAPIETVSPGRLDGLVPVASACPGFSWTDVPGAETYELAVFRITGGEAGEAGIADAGKPHLRIELPAGASSWAPDKNRCLERGQSYAWVVRARGAEVTGTWTEPRLFSVPAGPGPEEVAEAVEILRRHYEEGRGRARPKAVAGVGRTPREHASRDGATRGEGPEATTAEASLSSATPAIRGELPDTTGETVGVVGVTNSSDGAGVAAANADSGGGTDLLLDGAAQGVADTLVTESGIDRPAGSAQTFDFVNSQGNGMVLRVDGVQVVTTLTDQDTLAGLGCASGQLPEWDGASWTCGEDDDTVAELGCGTGEFPSWNGSAWECTTYSVDTISAVVPGAPQNLRLGPEPHHPSKRRLSWAMDDLAGVASFVAYQSDQPITDVNKANAAATVTGDLYAAVALFPGSGGQYFRVEARNVLGQAGPLSPELVVETAPRLAYKADQDDDEEEELFAVSPTGGGSTQVNDEFPSALHDVAIFSWSPAGGELAYLADQDTEGVNELYVASAAGGDATKVNDPLDGAGEVTFELAWSPDGTRLAYVADQETEGVEELFVAPATGGASTKVNDTLIGGGNVLDFAWSPDGTRLVYRADQDEDNVFELFVASASGGGSTKVNDGLVTNGDIQAYAWAPEGDRIAYIADQETDGTNELFVAPATGGGATKVNDSLTTGGEVQELSWSPEGSRLAYLADQESDGDDELFVVSATGGGSTKVNGDLAFGGDVKGDFAWSPDGTRLAYTADQETDNDFELFVAPATGGGFTKINDALVSGGDVDPEFAWSPDGTRIVYLADQETDNLDELFVAPATGGGATKLNGTLGSGGVLGGFAWSPDGTWVGYVADEETSGVDELFVAPATGGDSTKASDTLTSGGRVFFFEWAPLGSE